MLKVTFEMNNLYVYYHIYIYLHIHSYNIYTICDISPHAYSNPEVLNPWHWSLTRDDTLIPGICCAPGWLAGIETNRNMLVENLFLSLSLYSHSHRERGLWDLSSVISPSGPLSSSHLQTLPLSAVLTTSPLLFLWISSASCKCASDVAVYCIRIFLAC
jgi:hypothetical protein